MKEEWGPWIEHDGGPRPVPRGTVCHIVYADGEEWIGPVGVGAGGHIVDTGPGPWGGWCPIIYYRIRKPRGLTILEEIAQGVKQPEDA